MSANSDQTGVPSGGEPTGASTSSSHTAPRGATDSSAAPGIVPRLLIVALCAGISFPAAMVVENVRDTFGIPAEYDKYSQPPPEVLGPMMAAARSAQRKNSALVLGACGGLLCSLLGIAMGFAAASRRMAVLGAIDGIVIGGVGGAAGGVGNALVFQRFTESGIDEVYQAIIVHAPGWVLIGLSAGLVICVLNQLWFDVARILTAGAGAGLLAVVIFPIVSLQVFPAAHPAARFPDSFGSLVLWIGLSNGLIALAVMRTTLGRSHSKIHPPSTSSTSG